MAPKSNLPNNNGNCKTLSWTRVKDDALVDAFMHEYEKGNKVSDIFGATTYENIAVELTALFGNKVDKMEIKNRWKTLKRNFTEYYDIFKGGMSGFSWNSTTQIWDAESEVWDAFIEVTFDENFAFKNILLMNNCITFINHVFSVKTKSIKLEKCTISKL